MRHGEISKEKKSPTHLRTYSTPIVMQQLVLHANAALFHNFKVETAKYKLFFCLNAASLIVFRHTYKQTKTICIQMEHPSPLTIVAQVIRRI
jgi:hypothetical protein